MSLLRDRVLATAALLGVIGFLYQLSEILSKHSQWADFRAPAGVGELVFCAVCGLVAVAAALGIDLPNFLRGFLKEQR